MIFTSSPPPEPVREPVVIPQPPKPVAPSQLVEPVPIADLFEEKDETKEYFGIESQLFFGLIVALTVILISIGTYLYIGMLESQSMPKPTKQSTKTPITFSQEISKPIPIKTKSTSTSTSKKPSKKKSKK